MGIRKGIFTIMMTVLTASGALAQPDNSNIVKVDGEKYYLHIVDQGHTLYAISRLYGVTVDDITNANPEMGDVLGIGDELLIPVDAVSDEVTDNPPALDGSFLVHTVSEDETLYSLSRRYDVTIEEIVAANPGSEVSIQLGQELRIPIPDSNLVDTSNTNVVVAPPDTNRAAALPDLYTGPDSATVQADVYNVAIMLPFYLDANDHQWANTPINQEKVMHPNTRVALDFYQGALLAIDSLKEVGLSVNVHFYDTEGDSGTVADLLRGEEMGDMHLFIGPVGSNTLPLVTEFAKQNGRFVICPAPAGSRILLDNDHVCKAVPSTSTQLDHLASFVAKNYNTANVVLLNSGISKDENYVNYFDEAYSEYLLEYPERTHDAASMTNVGQFKADDLENHIVPDNVNVLVVPSNDLAYVTGFLTKMNALKPRTYENYQFVVFGLDSWKSWDNLDMNHKHRFNLHLVSPEHIDYSSSNVKNFVGDFRREFNTEPGDFGFMGYDVTLYHLQALLNYGTQLAPHFDVHKDKIAHTGFDYIKTGEESGYENQHVQILWYNDYQLKPVTNSLYWDEDNNVFEREGEE